MHPSTVCERWCVDCEGPIPNNAPENATRCFGCKGRAIQRARASDSKEQYADSSEEQSNHSRTDSINDNGQDYQADNEKERHLKSGADNSGWKVKSRKKRSPEREETDTSTVAETTVTAEEKEMSRMVGQITDEMAGL
jgi:hypothetical protein